ncbi:MAG TPA: hypothetical protein P5524_02030, partial [Candidatus Paceibacterota bacterium]|nr:hypothetical protein [Candidatus Paceibacterota bacterium]
MKYFKLFTVSLVLIIPLLLGLKAGTVLAVGDYSPGSLDLNVSPSNATTSIKISGGIEGGESDEGLCGSGRCENFVVYQVAQVQYQIDNGSWVSLAELSDWGQTVPGSNTNCSTCAVEHVYEYKYSKDIDVSGLKGGTHTVTVQARDSYGTWSASEDFTKPNVDLKVNDSNGPIAIPSG